MSSLPNVDDALSIMVQEEAQQSNIHTLTEVKTDLEASAFMGKGEIS